MMVLALAVLIAAQATNYTNQTDNVLGVSSPTNLFISVYDTDAASLLSKTQRRLLELSKLSRSKQIALQVKFLHECEKHNIGKSTVDRTTVWDYGTLDTIAVAL